MQPVFVEPSMSEGWILMIIISAMFAGLFWLFTYMSRSDPKNKNLGKNLSTACLAVIAVVWLVGGFLTLQDERTLDSEAVQSSLQEWSEARYNVVLSDSNTKELVGSGITDVYSIRDHEDIEQPIETYGFTKLNLADGPSTIVLINKNGKLFLTDVNAQEISKQ